MSPDTDPLRGAVEGLATALGLRSVNALWEAARVNKNDWNDRIRPYVSKPTGRKQVDRLVDGLAANLQLSPPQRQVLEVHRARLYEAIGVDSRLVGPHASAAQTAEPMLDALQNAVKEMWIDGVLNHSIAMSRIELCKSASPEAVERPWEVAARDDLESHDRPQPVAERIHGLFERAHRQLLILGGPGSGKTTSLLELAHHAAAAHDADPDRPVPVVLLLAAWSPDHNSFTEWLLAELNLRYHIPKRHARRWLADNRLIMLLDGLDELPEALRSECVRSINDFRQLGYGHVHMAVTCRTEAYGSLAVRLRLDSAIVIEPLTDAQISRYLDDCGPTGVAMRRMIDRDRRLLELAHAPLMLAVMQSSMGDEVEGADDAGAADDLDQASTASLRDHLFDDYIRYVFRRAGRRRGYSWERLHRYLGWLADAMSAHRRSIFSIEDLQPSWLPGPWSALCIALVGGIIGLCLAAPGMILCYLWIGNAMPALVWAVLFWLMWTLRTQQRTGPGWTSADALKVVVACMAGGLMVRVLQGYVATGHSLGEILTSGVQLGTTLAIAWGLTWLVRSRELLGVLERAWWWRHRYGLLLCLATVAAPFAWLFPVAGSGILATGPTLVLLAAAISLGLVAGLGAGAACLPGWQASNWDRLLLASLATAAVCFVMTVGLFMIIEPERLSGAHVLGGRAVFLGLVVGMMAVFMLTLRVLRPPRLPPESWSRDDIVIAAVLFSTCLSFIPDAGTLSTMLAVLLALVLDPGAIHPSRRIRLHWRRVLSVLMLSPLLAFFVSVAGTLASPLTSFTVAGIHAETSEPLGLMTMLAIAAVAGSGGGLIVLLAVGIQEGDPPVPARRGPGWKLPRAALFALAAVLGLGTVVWAATVTGYQALFGSANPSWAGAATLVLVTAAAYGVLINGGAFIVNHAVTYAALRRLDLIPPDLADLLDRCADMMILQRVGDGFLFVHPDLQGHLAALHRPSSRVVGPNSLEEAASESTL